MNSPQSPQKPEITDKKAPGSQVARRKRYAIVGLTMVVVIIPFGMYYLFFVTSQTTYFSKRNFRVLAEIGEHMSLKTANLATNLINVAEKAAKDKAEQEKEAAQDKSDRTQVESQSAPKVDNGRQEPKPQQPDVVKEAARLVPDFADSVRYQRDPTVTDKCDAASSNSNANAPASSTVAGSPGTGSGGQRPPDSESPDTTPEPVTLRVEAERGSFWLSLEYRSVLCPMPGAFSAKSDLNTLFDPFASRYVIDELNDTKERLFDEVLVAELADGRVIFERGPSGLNVATLDSLLDDKGGKLDLKLAEQSSSLVDVQLAGANYKLFLQPVRLTLPGKGDESKREGRWVVCGLTRTDHFRDATFAAPYTVLIFFVFVVLLAMLGWPLLRLKLMGPKDRLRRADLVLTLFSALMGTALLTFILWDLYTYSSLESTLDRHLKDLSKGIKDNFQEELGSALTQMKSLNFVIMTAAKKEKDAAEKEGRKTTGSEQSEALIALAQSQPSNPPNPVSTDNSAPTSGKESILKPGVLPEIAYWDYPYFNSATWTDPTGQQRIKWTTRSETTTFLRDVSGRAFFKNTKDGKLWNLPGSDFNYCLELVRTKNTGENAAVIATKVPGSSWISTLDTRLLSLMGPVLPGGYGYAVIDSSGKVLFHSDEVKNMEEQFFAECENDRGLRAAVLYRMDRPIDTNYLGKGHRMYVSALPATPWTLVVFADKQMARTINLEVVTLSIALYVVYALLVVALISLFWLLKVILFSGRHSKKDGDWTHLLWPNPKRAPQYELLIVSYALIACIFVVGQIIGGSFLVICCIGLPLLAAGLWWLILLWGPSGEGAKDEAGGLQSDQTPDRTPATSLRASPTKVRRAMYEKPLEILRTANFSIIARMTYRTRYAIAFAGLVVLLSALPATGFFQIALTSELTLMVKHGQVSMAKALEQRTQRVTSQYAAIEIGEGKADFLSRRLDPSSNNSNLDVYDSFFCGASRAGIDRTQFVEETPGLLDGLLLEMRPLYNQRCVESQGLAAVASPDTLWRWSIDREHHILLIKGRAGRERERSVELMSGTAGMAVPDRFWSWVGVIPLALLPLLSYGLVRFVSRRFFLLDTELPTCMDHPSATKPSRSRVLIWSPMTANGNEWGKGYYVEDLRPVKDWPAWTKDLASRSFKGSRFVVLNSFEHCVDDPAASREKLLAIEHLLKSKLSVVVVSTVDPLNSSPTPNPTGPVAVNGSNGKAAPSEPTAVEAKQNGAANVKVEYHSSVPLYVAIDGKQNGDDNKKPQAPAFSLPKDIQARWTALFTSWETVFAADNPPDQFIESHPGFRDILKTKEPWRYIVAIGKVLAENGTLPGKDCRDRAKIHEMISQVVEQARSYHQSIWDSCSEGQRCTLIQLAQHGMISPKNKHLRLLVKRGLVLRDPALRLMDESFRRFVIAVSRHQDVEGWRQQEGGSAWELLKAPLLLILVSVALFLFITQKEVYDSSISFMSAITAGIAALFRLLGMFHKDKAGSPILS